MVKQPIYRERLWPSAAVWLFAVLMLAAICVAAGNVYGYDTAAALFVATLVVLIISVFLTTATVSVDDAHFTVGRARLPIEYVGQISSLDKEHTIRARSRDAHPDAYYAIRSWIPESVVVVIADETDPHPYWHVSSRNSAKLKEALESVNKH